MKLSDLIADLEAGEFRQLSLGTAGGEIPADKYPELGSSLNLALTALHTRFQLRKGVESLTHNGSPSYTLVADDLLKIEEVVAATGIPVYLEKPEEERHVLLVDYRTLTFAAAITDTDFEVHYRARHTPIVLTAATDPTTVDITLPPSHRQALLYRIASRFFRPLDRADGTSFGAQFMAMYETECLDLERKNVSPEQREQYADKLEMRRWP